MALRDIVAHKKIGAAALADRIMAQRDQLTLSTKSLLTALKSPGCSFICEIKKASPSQGAINAKADVRRIANIYAPLASAISVLADEKFFGGSFDDVALVGQSQDIPILCKDVVVSPVQIYQARLAHADAVLLMLSVLNDEEYRALAKVALSLNLDVVCEVHTEQELARAIKLGAKIIGINNRDLTTLTIDFDNTNKLLPKIPAGTVVISESGFASRAHVKKYLGKVDAMLIGTSLMKAARIDLALRELMFGRVKICGLTNRADASLAYDCGAYYGGLNFYEKSPRAVNVAVAKDIMAGVPLVWGGVFVQQALEFVSSIACELALDFVQLHGDESPDYIRSLRATLPRTCQIWQAVRVKDSLPEFFHDADRIVLDKFSERAFGGTGQAFDWEMLKNYPHRDKIILAGGVGVNNIVAADACGVWAIDIASGVEENNVRQKSPSLMKTVFAKLKGA